ncbi:hypothetical protein MASR2M44_24740 [Bacteroidota bacterium]
MPYKMIYDPEGVEPISQNLEPINPRIPSGFGGEFESDIEFTMTPKGSKVYRENNVNANLRP